MVRLLCAMAIVGVTALPVAAQSRDRLWGQVSFGAAASTAGEESRRFEGRLFGQPFVDQATYPAPATTATFDVGAGLWITDRLGLGVSAARTSRDYTIDLDVTVPHPTLLNASATALASTEATRSETDVHLQVAWAIVDRENLHLRALIGPTVFRFRDFITRGLDASQRVSGATNTVTIAAVDGGYVTKTALGAHLGVDGSCFFSRHVGVGLMARLSHGSVDLDEPEAAPATAPLPTSFLPEHTGDGGIGVGGFVIAAGLRLRF